MPRTPPLNRYARNELRPLPMRISQLAYERLERLRELDDLPIQEHIRRAVDYYLTHAEVSIAIATTAEFKDAVASMRAQAEETGVDRSDAIAKLIGKHAPKFARPTKVIAK
jgi:hypothetical protein